MVLERQRTIEFKKKLEFLLSMINFLEDFQTRKSFEILSTINKDNQNINCKQN